LGPAQHITIPDQFHRYHSIFSEKASHRLPKHQPWDHAIDIKPDKELKKSYLYALNPTERQAEKDYITEHLAKGYICESKLSYTSPFFFIAKKGKDLCPIQDYRALNDITIKNATPLPLIPDLFRQTPRLPLLHQIRHPMGI
jgi:hypothetical protein